MPNLRAEKVKEHLSEITTLSDKISKKDNEMKVMDLKVKQILNKGVAVGDLSELLIKKFMNFLQSQVVVNNEQTRSLVPLSVEKMNRNQSAKQQD